MSITGKTRVVGVWGHPVGHSRSPAMHNAALAHLGLDWVYVPFDVQPDAVREAVAGIRAMGLVGVNVTVPLKERVLPLLDVVDENAARIGSVNTIHNVDGRLHGHSTDGAGFLHTLKPADFAPAGKRALLLGAGGSARAVAFALAGAGADVQIANRTRARAEELAGQVNKWLPGSASVAEWGGASDEFDLLVNATSLGMSPREGEMPALPAQGLRPGVLVYDLIYAPPETRLLALAREQDCATLNGAGMLAVQGAVSLSIWTGLLFDAIPLALMEQAARENLPESAPSPQPPLRIGGAGEELLVPPELGASGPL